MSPERLGVVIPTLDEAHHLPALLQDLAELAVPSRIVVSDGGSRDDTIRVAGEGGAECVSSPPGRAVQLNAGARILDTPWLLFLHADSRLPATSRAAVAQWLASDPDSSAAYFRFALTGEGWFWRFIELGQWIRERVSGLVYGDQGLLVTREAFDAIGGYPELPLMEDVEIVRRLRRTAGLERLEGPLFTSPRAYERYGRWREWLRNTATISLYMAGMAPNRLARWYPRGRRSVEGQVARDDSFDGRALMVFAKAPQPGSVKTRLAADIGDLEAASVYRVLGRRVLDQVRDGSYRTVVYYDPPEAVSTVREWLGDAGVEYRPQRGGGLGERLEHAFAEAFEASRRVCVIGTDAPGVDRKRVEQAFDSLDGSDVVFGPTWDGGYYLIGLNRPQPELFRGVPWSTDQVFEASFERASSLGLRPSTLPALSDIDTLEDLEEVGL